MNARRVLRRLVIGFSVLSLVMMGLLWYGLSSERVARRLVATALARAGDGISIGEVSGSIGGPLMVRDVSIERETFAATIDSALLDWTPTGLLRRQVRIDRLHAEGVHITIPDSVPRDSAPPRPSLPMDVILGDVLVRSLSVDAPGDLTLRRGTLRLDGRAEDFRFVAEGDVTMPRLEDAPVVASGTGNLDHIMLAGASASVLEGTVSAVGRVTWWPRTEWNLAIQGTGIEPALLTEDPATWPGSIAFDGRTSGHLDSLGPIGSLIIDSLGGALRDQPLRATGTVGFAGPSFESPGLTVSWGSAQLTGSGTVGDTIAAAYRLAISNLGTALPAAGGSLSARGSVSGTRNAPRVQAAFSGSDIRYGNNTAGQAEGQADVHLAPSGRTTVTIHGTEARAGNLAIDSLELLMRGTQDRHRITATASGPDGSGSLLLAGGLAGSRWRGQLQDFLVQAGSYGSWKLARPATLAAALERASLGQTCLASEEFPGARVCAGGEWLGGRNWRASSVMERFPLTLLDSLVPDSVLGDSQRLAGTVSAVLEAASRGGRLEGRLVARADSVALRYQRVLDTAPRWIALDTAAAEFTVGAQGLQGKLYIHALHHDSVAAGWLSGTVALPRFTRLGLPLESQPIEAGIEGHIDTLGYAAEYFPGMDSLAGSVVLDAQLAGMAAAPTFEVRLDFDSLFLWLPRGRAGQGSVALHAQGHMNADRSLAGTLEVVPRGVIYDYTLDELPRRVFVDSGGLTGAAGPDGTSATFVLGVSDSADNRILSLAADLSLPGYTALGLPTAAEPFEARLEAEVPSFAFVRAATDRYDSLAGSISLTASAGGRTATPNLEAQLRIDSLYARSITGTETRASLLGTLSAAVADDSTLSGLLRLTPGNVRFAYVEGGVFEEIRLNPTELEVRAGPDGVRGALDLAIADTMGAVLGTFGGRFALPDYRRYGQPIADAGLEATFQGEVQDLAFAEAFSAEVDSLAGSLDLDVRMTGTVGDPDWAGGFRLSDGAMRLPLLGALYHDIQLAATGTEAGDIRVEGGAESGAGEVTVNGTTPVRPTADQPGRFEIRGNDFEVMNTAQVHAVVDPELDVTLIGDTIDLRGTINVPLARIQLTEIPEFAVPPSDDVVFVGDTAAPPPARPIRAEVQMVLGDSVSFSGFNFNAELDGALLLMESPGRATTASGAVIIETGSYKAYGQDLTVSGGRVQFAGGPVDNPSLSIRASRTADDGTEAGLAISGTLKAPVVTIWSEPAMSQDSALHYIVTGRAPGEGSVASGGLLSEAASSLGLRGSNVLARSLGEGFGLDDARIETEDGLHEASFVAGAYLSPSLYVSYGIGLFDPISTLRLRYLLSERWTLQAEAGTETGADLLYRIER